MGPCVNAFHLVVDPYGLFSNNRATGKKYHIEYKSALVSPAGWWSIDVIYKECNEASPACWMRT